MNTALADDILESSGEDVTNLDSWVGGEAYKRRWTKDYDSSGQSSLEGNPLFAPSVTDELVDLDPIQKPMLWAPSIKPSAERFTALQKWEGTVLQVEGDAFAARLHDLTSGGAPEEAEFPIAEIADDDMDLLSPGAVFYWSIGYLDQRSGQRIRASMIRFRRLPAWSARDIQEAQHRAAELGSHWNEE